MNKLKIRYRLIIGFNLIGIIGFILLRLILKQYAQNLIDFNGALIGTLGAAWIIVVGIDLYLLLLLIISFSGFLIYKHKNKTEQRIAFRYQSLILLVIWLGFSTYWMIIRN
jgi:hypothetical protein